MTKVSVTATVAILAAVLYIGVVVTLNSWPTPISKAEPVARTAEAVAYAKAISVEQDRSDLQDVQHVGGSVYTAVFSDACYLIDLDHPILDTQTRC